MIFSREFSKYFLKKKSGSEPEGSVVRSYQSPVIQGSVAVVPGTHMKTAQKSTADKFYEKKSDSINAAADKKRDSRKFTGERADDGTASVNGKH